MTANDFDRYEKSMSAWGEKLDPYPEHLTKTVTANGRVDYITELRSINLITPFLPKIHDAQLIKLSSGNSKAIKILHFHKIFRILTT